MFKLLSKRTALIYFTACSNYTEIHDPPADAPSLVRYSSRKYRNLGMLRIVWEAFLQYYSVAKTQSRVNDVHIHVGYTIITGAV